MNKQAKNTLAIALDLFFQKHGPVEYNSLVENIKSNDGNKKNQAIDTLKTFIDENIDYVQEESALQNVSDSIKNE